MVDIKCQKRLRINASEVVEYSLLPPFGKVRLGIHVLSEEPIFVGNPQEIEDGRYHIEVGNQDGLRQVFGKIDIRLRNTRPKTGNGFAEHLDVHLGKMRSNLKSLIDLVRFQFSDGNAANQLSKRFLAQAQVNICNLHKKVGYHGRVPSGDGSPVIRRRAGRWSGWLLTIPCVL